uniref:Uncharacterized protein n=1 Tax=Anguilla anguilla TaxID=7936 RepID=A0A0E9WIU6_ANGAN
MHNLFFYYLTCSSAVKRSLQPCSTASNYNREHSGSLPFFVHSRLKVGRVGYSVLLRRGNTHCTHRIMCALEISRVSALFMEGVVHAATNYCVLRMCACQFFLVGYRLIPGFMCTQN